MPPKGVAFVVYKAPQACLVGALYTTNSALCAIYYLLLPSRLRGSTERSEGQVLEIITKKRAPKCSFFVLSNPYRLALLQGGIAQMVEARQFVFADAERLAQTV